MTNKLMLQQLLSCSHDTRPRTLVSTLHSCLHTQVQSCCCMQLAAAAHLSCRAGSQPPALAISFILHRHLFSLYHVKLTLILCLVVPQRHPHCRGWFGSLHSGLWWWAGALRCLWYRLDKPCRDIAKFSCSETLRLPPILNGGNRNREGTTWCR